MTEDVQGDMLRLAAGLREMQATLDASRSDAQVRDSERRRLVREVDILSHLLCSHESDVQRQADARFADAAVLGRDGLLADTETEEGAGSSSPREAS